MLVFGFRDNGERVEVRFGLFSIVYDERIYSVWGLLVLFSWIVGEERVLFLLFLDLYANIIFVLE